MFGEGDNKYPGFIAIRDIPENEAILAVPESQLISIKRIQREDPDLYKLMLLECPSLFSPDVNDEYE